MEQTIVIRPYRPADRAAIRALYDRTPPAGQTATAAQRWPPDLDHIASTYRAFWVALDAEAPGEPVVGMVGLQPPGNEVPTAVLCGRQGYRATQADARRAGVATSRHRTPVVGDRYSLGA